MDLVTARARIHAMFTAPDQAAEQELDCRLNELIAAAAGSIEYAVQYPDRQTVMADTITPDRARAEASLRAHRELDSQMWAESRIVQRAVASTWVEAPTYVARDGQCDQANRIVAYRHQHDLGVLLCREHGERWQGVYPVTAEDLPEGGICTFGRLSSLTCGRDVLTA